MTITDLSYVTVQGTFLNLLTSEPSVGQVRFTLSGRLVNQATGQIVTPEDFTAVLDGSGQFSLTLPCTDDPDFLPADRFWTVTEFIDGHTRSYAIDLPSSPPTQDLADIAPLDPTLPNIVYQLAGFGQITDGPKGDVTVSGSGTVWSVTGIEADNVSADTTGFAHSSSTDVQGVLSDLDGAITSGSVASVNPGHGIDISGTASDPVVDVDESELDIALMGGTMLDGQVPSTVARDTEVTAAVAAEATLARNGNNITSGTVADARIAATIARDSEVTSAIAALSTVYAPFTAPVASLTPTTGTVTLDFSTFNGEYLDHPLSGDVTYATSNLAAGRTITVRVTAASIQTLAFPSWDWVGDAPPSSIAAGETAVLALVSYGTTDADVVAAWPSSAAGGGLTALTGDVTASGSGSVAATLATVNSNVGSFGDATHVGAVTVDGKGRVTAASSVTIAIPESAVTNLTSDLAAKAPLASPTFTGAPNGPTWKSTGNTGANTTPVTLTGSNATGSPASGAHVKGEVAGDDTGKLWYCTVAGTPGTWVNVGGSASVADGDYGDIVIASGVWSFDTAVVTAAAKTVLDDTTVGAMLTTMGGAPLASPTFTGTPAAPTATAGTNTTQVATTAFVTTAVAGGGGGGSATPFATIYAFGG